MNISERRSIQRRGWLGMGFVLAILALGVTLFTVSVSLFFAVLLGVLLLGAFTAGSVLLLQQLASRRDLQLALNRGKDR